MLFNSRSHPTAWYVKVGLIASIALGGCSDATAPATVSGTYVLTTASAGPLPVVYKTLNAPGISSATYAVAGATIALDDTAKALTGEVDIQTKTVDLETPNADTVVATTSYPWHNSYERSGKTVTLSIPDDNPIGLPASITVQEQKLIVTMGGIAFTFVKQ